MSFDAVLPAIGPSEGMQIQYTLSIDDDQSRIDILIDPTTGQTCWRIRIGPTIATVFLAPDEASAVALATSAEVQGVVVDAMALQQAVLGQTHRTVPVSQTMTVATMPVVALFDRLTPLKPTLKSVFGTGAIRRWRDGSPR